MGAEARCQLQVDGAVHDGKALLETDELLFRGDKPGTERAVRLAIPLASIRSVSGTNGALRVRFDGGEATFLLGAHAEKWAGKDSLAEVTDRQVGCEAGAYGVGRRSR